jgi:hypothetical protein
VSSLAGQSLNGHSPRWVSASFAEASSCVVAQGERRVSQIRHLAGAVASVTLGERPGHSRARPIGGIGRARFTVDLRPATAGKGLPILPADYALTCGGDYGVAGSTQIGHLWCLGRGEAKRLTLASPTGFRCRTPSMRLCMAGLPAVGSLERPVRCLAGVQAPCYGSGAEPGFGLPGISICISVTRLISSRLVSTPAAGRCSGRGPQPCPGVGRAAPGAVPSRTTRDPGGAGG